MTSSDLTRLKQLEQPRRLKVVFVAMWGRFRHHNVIVKSEC